MLDGAGNWAQVDAETRQHSSFNEITVRDPGAPITVLSDDDSNVYDDGTLVLEWDFANRLRKATKVWGEPQPSPAGTPFTVNPKG